MRRRHRWPAVLIAVLVCGPAGCDSAKPSSWGSAAPSRPAVRFLDAAEVDRGIAEQRRIVADGVDRQDYLASVARFEKCLGRHGLELKNNGWNPVDNLTMELQFGNPKMSDDEVLGYGDECQNAYLDTVSGAYVEATVAVMDPALLTRVHTCLGDRGFTVRGERNLDELGRLVGPAREPELLDCAEAAVREVFPDRAVTIRTRGDD